MEGIADLDAGVGDVVQALPRVLGEATLQQSAGRGRRVCGQRFPVWLLLEDRRQRVGDGLARKRPLARQHLVEHAAERPDVGALVEDMPAHLLGAHVGGGPQQDPRLRGGDRRRR